MFIGSWLSTFCSFWGYCQSEYCVEDFGKFIATTKGEGEQPDNFPCIAAEVEEVTYKAYYCIFLTGLIGNYKRGNKFYGYTIVPDYNYTVH